VDGLDSFRTKTVVRGFEGGVWGRREEKPTMKGRPTGRLGGRVEEKKSRRHGGDGYLLAERSLKVSEEK